jgi:outer membrane biosynthesis protein TonB
MSEIENTPTPNEPEAKKEPKAPKAKPMSVAQLSDKIAKVKKTDPKVEAKKLRGHIRANFDTLAPKWPALKKQGKVNRDGNRYPEIPAALAKELLAKRTKSTKA